MPCEITAPSMSPSIRSVYRSARSSGVPSRSRGTTWAPRKVITSCIGSQGARLLQQVETAQLLPDRQAVSRLDLQRRDPTGHDPLQRGHEPAQQLVVAGVSGWRPRSTRYRRRERQPRPAMHLPIARRTRGCARRRTTDGCGTRPVPAARSDRAASMVGTSSSPCVASTSSVRPTATITPPRIAMAPSSTRSSSALRRPTARLAGVDDASQRRGVHHVEIAHWQYSRMSCSYTSTASRYCASYTYSSGKLYGGSPGPKLTPGTPNSSNATRSHQNGTP